MIAIAVACITNSADAKMLYMAAMYSCKSSILLSVKGYRSEQ